MCSHHFITLSLDVCIGGCHGTYVEVRTTPGMVLSFIVWTPGIECLFLGLAAPTELSQDPTFCSSEKTKWALHLFTLGWGNCFQPFCFAFKNKGLKTRVRTILKALGLNFTSYPDGVWSCVPLKLYIFMLFNFQRLSGLNFLSMWPTKRQETLMKSP